MRAELVQDRDREFLHCDECVLLPTSKVVVYMHVSRIIIVTLSRSLRQMLCCPTRHFCDLALVGMGHTRSQ